MKIDRAGRIFIADYRRGNLMLEDDQKAPVEIVGAFRSEGFRGCNDLYLSGAEICGSPTRGRPGCTILPAHSSAWTSRVRCVAFSATSPIPMPGDEQQRDPALRETRANAVWRLPLMEDGSVSKVGMFIQLSGGLAGPDGLALDTDGGLIAAHPGHRHLAV